MGPTSRTTTAIKRVVLGCDVDGPQRAFRLEQTARRGMEQQKVLHVEGLQRSLDCM
jgi:hypothetical protein